MTAQTTRVWLLEDKKPSVKKQAIKHTHRVFRTPEAARKAAEDIVMGSGQRSSPLFGFPIPNPPLKAGYVSMVAEGKIHLCIYCLALSEG